MKMLPMRHAAVLIAARLNQPMKHVIKERAHRESGEQSKGHRWKKKTRRYHHHMRAKSRKASR